MFLTLSIYGAKAQINENEMRLKVLKKNLIGKQFVFGKWTANGETETHLSYLGQITTTRGKNFKILNSVSFWGQSRRATSRILIFDGNNNYVGNYYLTSIYDLPTKLIDSKLVFYNTDFNCDKKTVTTVDLKKGLPNKFFRKCSTNSGDFYSLDTE